VAVAVPGDGGLSAIRRSVAKPALPDAVLLLAQIM
jgi:hypothetical protein